jgi:nicotinate-nucleotide--dimethylbenzimidazole phosphoribosyltransferase
MVASHLSPVPGHKIALDALGLTPLLELGIRRGEATGAMLCIPLIESAGAVFRSLPRIETEGEFDLIDPWEPHSS